MTERDEAVEALARMLGVTVEVYTGRRADAYDMDSHRKRAREMLAELGAVVVDSELLRRYRYPDIEESRERARGAIGGAMTTEWDEAVTYYPVDCPLCSRRRVLPTEEGPTCEKCGYVCALAAVDPALVEAVREADDRHAAALAAEAANDHEPHAEKLRYATMHATTALRLAHARLGAAVAAAVPR